MVLILRKKTSV